MRSTLALCLLLSAVASASIPKALLQALDKDGDQPMPANGAWLGPEADSCVAALEQATDTIPESCNPGPGDTVVGVSADGGTVAQWGGVELDGCVENVVASELRLINVATGHVKRQPLAGPCVRDEDLEVCYRRRLLAAWRGARTLREQGYRSALNLITGLAWAEADAVHLNAPVARLGGALAGQLLYAKRGAQIGLELESVDQHRTKRLGQLTPQRQGEDRPTVVHVSVEKGRVLVVVGLHDGADCSPAVPIFGSFAVPRGISLKVPLAPSPEAGPADALITLVEVSDLQCPFCARVEPTIATLQRRYGKNLRRVFKNNALSFHKRARPAALAALAAHQQGKFWSYSRRLFENQRALEDADLERYAHEEQLDLPRFRSDLARPDLAAQVDNEQRSAVGLGLAATPSFLVNGKVVRGAQPESAFVEVIHEEIVAMEALIRTGLSVAEARTLRLKANLGDQYTLYAHNLIGGQVAPPPSRAPAAPPVVDTTVWRLPIHGHEPTVGPADALVTAVVFMDLECPFCARHLPNVLRLAKENPEVRLVFKHLPLTFHPRARPAARAAVAAHAQGQFWPFVTRVFENVKALSDLDLEAHAEALGLDLPRFRAEQDGADAQLDLDVRDAADINVRGTPQTFVNGRNLKGAVGYEQLAALVAEEQKKAAARVDAGTPRQGLYEALQKGAKVFAALDEQAHTFSEDRAPRLGSVGPNKVTLVVYVDYQCPYSKRLQPILESLVSDPDLADRLTVVFKHYPLSMHPHAREAALAVAAAYRQGKALELHRALFGLTEALTPEGIRAAAEGVGLNMQRFDQDRAAPEAEALLERDHREGMAADMKGTPQLYMAGHKFLAPSGLADVKQAALKLLAAP